MTAAAAPMPWLTARTTILLPEGWPSAYEFLVEHVAESLADDATWQSWWAKSGVPECQLFLTLQDDATGSTVTVRREQVEVHHAERPEPIESREPAVLLTRAAADVTEMLEAVRRELALDPLPAMALPDPPDDLPRGTQHPGDRELPAFLAGAGTEGFLRSLITRLRGRQ